MGSVTAGPELPQIWLNCESSWTRSPFKLNSFPHPYLIILPTRRAGPAARKTHKAERHVARLDSLTHHRYGRMCPCNFGGKINYVANQQTATQNNTVDGNRTEKKNTLNRKQFQLAVQPETNVLKREWMTFQVHEKLHQVLHLGGTREAWCALS